MAYMRPQLRTSTESAHDGKFELQNINTISGMDQVILIHTNIAPNNVHHNYALIPSKLIQGK